MERTLQISRALVHEGHQCTILTTDTGLSHNYMRQCEKWGFKVVALHSFWQQFYLINPIQGIVKKLVAEADIVHLMNHWTLINAIVYRAAKELKKPYVICPAGSLLIYGKYSNFKKLYNYIIGQEIIRDADGYIAIAPNEIEHYESYGVHAGMVTIIPNGVNPEDFPESDGGKFRARYGIGDAPLILFLGRLNVIKGPDLLLEAFCRCNENEEFHAYHLIFIGPDEGMLPRLKRMISESGLNDRVYFTGHIGRDEKSDAYQAANLMAIPSRHEAMSIVVLEAGICGTPVLITDQCGFDDVALVEGGVVVEATVEGLRDGLLAMTGSPARLKIMGQNLTKYTRDHFLWEHIVKRHLELFAKIVH